MKSYEMLIDGRWTPAGSGKTFPVLNPATEEVLAHVPDAGAQDVARAVEAARRAALRLANDTRYGLAAAVWPTGQAGLHQPERAADRLVLKQARTT